MSNIFIGLKKTCLGVLDRGERGDDNGTSLKEGGVIKMSTTVLHYAMLAPSLEYLPISIVFVISVVDHIPMDRISNKVNVSMEEKAE